jgi:hypothetical protein
MRSGSALRVGVLIVAVLVSSGCGAPRDGEVRRVAADDVPYHLLDNGSEARKASPGPGQATTTPQVFLLDGEDRLVARSVPVPAGSLAAVEASLLAALRDGPSEQQRASGLSSALGPGALLTMHGVVDGTARIEIVLPDAGATADRLPLAVGQVVLTAVSVEGVDRVLLEQDGGPVAAPLPGGAQTLEPVSASDYAQLLADTADRPVKAPPTAAATPTR